MNKIVATSDYCGKLIASYNIGEDEVIFKAFEILYKRSKRQSLDRQDSNDLLGILVENKVLYEDHIVSKAIEILQARCDNLKAA